jgi:hypothetical protein
MRCRASCRAGPRARRRPWRREDRPRPVRAACALTPQNVPRRLDAGSRAKAGSRLSGRRPRRPVQLIHQSAGEDCDATTRAGGAPGSLCGS